MTYSGPERRFEKRVNSLRWRLLGVWIAIFTAATAYALVALWAAQDDIRSDRATRAVLVCERTTALIQNVLLESLGVSAADYARHPHESVVAAIGARLDGGAKASDIKMAVDRTERILRVADPRTCVKVAG